MLSARNLLHTRTLLAIAVAAAAAVPAALAQGGAQPNITGLGTLNPNGQKPVSFSRDTRTSNGMGPVTLPENFASIVIAPGFLLNVQVFDEPGYSGQLRVSNSGDVNVPTAGTVHVAGDTLQTAASKIEQRFIDARILRHPQVTLDLAEYSGGKVAVLGEVQNPGTLPLLAPESLETVLGDAGGETSLAGDRVTVTPANGGAASAAIYSKRSTAHPLSEVLVHPGDTVRVERAGIVYVLGAVAKPGGYVMQEDGHLDVMQALALANGTSLDAATGSIRIVRRDDQGRATTYHVPFEALTKGKQMPVTLQPEDIVYVPVNKLKAVLTQSIVASLPAAALYAH